ncbi:hypothetical protein C8A01DRAFT_14737 [Parachaetomium inaequale]|uniref:Uncharacterized protein n=1 Tax=Parachaetomium inaequale TaxID=2588326 RepID=A0AAN6SSI3_9PEZI|nr:hypothetical protein C8A01DRAFT_14737 [Parachaetomium inaequale]
MQYLAQRRPRVAVEVLDLDHYHPLIRALSNVLSTDLAQVTYAQLIDGLPMVGTAWDMRAYLLFKEHPLVTHDKLCEGAMERAQVFCGTFDPVMLQFDSLVCGNPPPPVNTALDSDMRQVMQRYQDATPGSREFKMRLVELVAAAIHQIAILLFQSDDKLHSKEDIDDVVSWKKESEWVVFSPRHRVLQEYPDPRPTLFYHAAYVDYQQYPHGLADVAGYWAEDRIFGGVAVFDRGVSGTECNDIYFHSGRQDTTFRVWRLLDSQFSELAEFLLSEQPCTPPFPIIASYANKHRHDPWDAIALHHIFRDPWEREVPPTKPDDGRDVRSAGDYPEVDDMFDAVQAAVDRAVDESGEKGKSEE